MATDVVMPQMGESIAEGTITKWLKNVGDHVDRDEPLFEISTDKVDAEIPSPAAGTLTEVRFKEGDTVEINTVVAVLDGGAEVAASPAPSIAEEPKTAASPKETEAVVAKPAVEAEPPVVPAAQSKEQTTLPASAFDAGVDTAAEPERTPPIEEAKPVISESKPTTPAPKPTPAPRGNGGPAASVEDLRRTKSSPLVRKIASEHGIDIAGLEGTGLSGRVTKNDILSFIESAGSAQRAAAPPPATAPAPAPQVVKASSPSPRIEPVAPSLRPAAGDRVEQMSVMRKKIADHMVLSRRTSA